MNIPAESAIGSGGGRYVPGTEKPTELYTDASTFGSLCMLHAPPSAAKKWEETKRAANLANMLNISIVRLNLNALVELAPAYSEQYTISRMMETNRKQIYLSATAKFF